MKDIILKLKSENPNATLKEIASLAKTSINTVRYHLSPAERDRRLRVGYSRKQNVIDIKTELGGRCMICHYDRCLAALDFHHISQSTKEGLVSRLAMSGGSKSKARAEAKKCVLLCCRCHREVHAGLLSLDKNGGDTR